MPVNSPSKHVSVHVTYEGLVPPGVVTEAAGVYTIRVVVHRSASGWAHGEIIDPNGRIYPLSQDRALTAYPRGRMAQLFDA